jgi:hypothetical protein
VFLYSNITATYAAPDCRIKTSLPRTEVLISTIVSIPVQEINQYLSPLAKVKVTGIET